MKVTVYFPTYSDKQFNTLHALGLGIPGCMMKPLEKFSPNDGDIGVVFGWFKFAYLPTMDKKPVIEHYLSLGDRRLLVVESAFQRRGEYYQIGWNGFAGNADFMSENSPPDRWTNLNIPVKPWKTGSQGKCIVVGQLPRDTQVQHTEHTRWCRRMLEKAQHHYGSKNVVFRPHPKCDDPKIYKIHPRHISTGNLEQALDDARCVVTFNSTTCVDAILAGVPVVTMNRGSMAWNMSTHRIDEPLIYPDRGPWLNAIGYSQWTLAEMKNGLPWKHLNP